MAWKPLQFSASAGAQLPSFLISSEFYKDSYTVRLTDLTNTWTEKIDHDAIIERSSEEDTSIDPSEDEDQLSIFLDKIKLGLAGGKDTSLSLQVAAGTESGPLPHLLLHVKIPLPGGLKDLKWRYELSPQGPKETINKFVHPNLIALQEKRKEVEGLVDLLEEKDAVIQKLVDTLENQGTDLGTIFHQASGRAGRKVDRKKASEKVKGLKVFDIEAWKRELQFDHAKDGWELLNNVFGSNDIGSNISTAHGFDKEDGEFQWWGHMQGKTVGILGNNTTTTLRDLPRRNIEQVHVPPEDDFQRQSTPPHLSKSKAKPDTSMDDSTDDDDDLDAPSQRSRIPDSLPISQARASSPNRTSTPSSSPRQVTKSANKLGTKRKASTPTPASQTADDTTEDDEPMPASSHSTKTINDDDDNANDTTDDDALSSLPSMSKRRQTPQKSPTPQSPLPKKKSKLGKIGGKKAPSPSPEPEIEPEVEPEAMKPRPKRGMLGKIGGKKNNPTSTAEIEPQSSASPKKKLGTIGGKKATAGGSSQREDTPGEENRGRKREQAIEEEKIREKTPPPRETSEERADKKRAMLKKELEAKSKAPVKKKRKF